jgi:hypothetical protein
MGGSAIRCRMESELANAITDANQPQQREWPMRIGIARRDDGYHAFALEAIAAGEVVLEISGVLVDQADRYSVQVGEQMHVRPPAELGPDNDDPRYRWRFLNHSCRPNAAMRGTLLVAIAPIAAAAEVTFDYNTTELEIACPFECRCGHCGGEMIRGFGHLSPVEQRRREGLVGAHLI